METHITYVKTSSGEPTEKRDAEKRKQSNKVSHQRSLTRCRPDRSAEDILCLSLR